MNLRLPVVGIVVLIAGYGLALPAHHPPGQERDFNAYPTEVVKYLERLYSRSERQLAFREDYPGGMRKWQQDARSALRIKLGLDKIQASARSHRPSVKLGHVEDMGSYIRQSGSIETEPDVRLPFWLLKPKSEGRHPLGIFPHGHDARGPNTAAGVFNDETERAQALAEDRDVAVQAVGHGFMAISPAVRGLFAGGVPDLLGRHGERDCRSHLMHCLLAGRTALGERVWDMQRILDWAVRLPEVDPAKVLVMGNSGGGLVTIFTAACDERVQMAVPSCSFSSTTSEAGYIFHCDCNMVPGILQLGDLSDIAGLIAPRYQLAVNGRRDTLFSASAVERAVEHLRAIYRASGNPGRFSHLWGSEGHRFYKDLMWPFVHRVFREGK